uniref:Uncharacterized protein n=1 Tax=Lotus japonicus TaxID=34305 RepID=I3T1E0_LOTJA|nr:unknown [Lotus japonicus]
MSLSGLVIALSVAFGCFLLALAAELCYLLWWKKRRTHTETEEEDHSNDAKGLLNGVCWKAPSTTNSVTVRSSEPENKSHEPDLELGKDVAGLKNFGEEGVECELMRLHNLAGPPRFLFTIKEESKEDLDSEDGRSRKGSRTRSLSDIMVATIDSPFLNPVASSPLKCSLDGLDSFKHQGFNPLFESSMESELNRFRSNSPPPKFKFLRDAEEKLYRRLIEEAQRKAKANGSVAESEAKVSLIQYQ